MTVVVTYQGTSLGQTGFGSGTGYSFGMPATGYAYGYERDGLEDYARRLARDFEARDSFLRYRPELDFHRWVNGTSHRYVPAPLGDCTLRPHRAPAPRLRFHRLPWSPWRNPRPHPRHPRRLHRLKAARRSAAALARRTAT